MEYLDTSVLVAAMTTETRSHEIQAWLSQAQHLAISGWVITEFSGALSAKLRSKEISAEFRARALADFSALCQDSLTVLPIGSHHFATAARIADQHALGLRAADALHLAIALDHGAVVATLDRRMATAGADLGVQTLLL